MRAGLDNTGSDLSADSLEVGALAGKILKTTAVVLGVELLEAVVGAGRNGGDGAAGAGGGNGGDGGRDTGSADGGGVGGGDAQAAAGRRVCGAVIAGRGVCRDGAGGDGDLADIDGAGSHLVTRAASGLGDEGRHGASATPRYCQYIWTSSQR